MVDSPLVSVVVPCLNRAPLLVQTLESILQQDYPHLECIVIDGGSTDGTIEILKSYGDALSWVSEPDDGHADAINKGWHMSNGDVLAWLNADDLYVVPDAISKAMSYLRANPHVDVIYGDYARVSEDGETISDIIKPLPWDLVYAVKYCHYIIPQPASFIRRSILAEVDWLDQKFRNGKDHELWLRIGLVGTIEYVNIHMAYARMSPGLSQQVSMGKAKVDLTKKFFHQPNLPAPFDSTKFQKRALSNAYVVGGLYILDGTGDISPTLNFLLKAIAVDPMNAPLALIKITRRLLSRIVSKR